MASLLKRSTRFYADFYDSGRSPKRRRLSLKTERRRVARRLLSDLEDAYAAGLWDPWVDDISAFHDRPEKAATLEEACAKFMEFKRGEDLSRHTLKLYRTKLSGLLAEVGEEQPLERITAAQIRRYTRAEGLAQSTQRTRHAVIRALLNWLRRRGHMDSDPLRHSRPPKRQPQKPRALRPEMLQKMIRALRDDYAARRSGGADYRGCAGTAGEGEMIWQAGLWRFALYTGMRIGELSRLRWKHIDKEAGTILIEKQKSGAVSRIPLARKAREALPEEEGAPGDYVFRSPQGHARERSEEAWADRASKRFCHYRREAGLPDRITFHSTRHGFCTLLAEAGKSAFVIKEAARHSSVEVSQRYVKLAGKRLKEEIEDVFG